MAHAVVGALELLQAPLFDVVVVLIEPGKGVAEPRQLPAEPYEGAGIQVERGHVVEVEVAHAPPELALAALLLPEKEKVRENLVPVVDEIAEAAGDHERYCHPAVVVLTVHLVHQTGPLFETNGALLVDEEAVAFVFVVVFPHMFVHGGVGGREVFLPGVFHHPQLVNILVGISAEGAVGKRQKTLALPSQGLQLFAHLGVHHHLGQHVEKLRLGAPEQEVALGGGHGHKLLYTHKALVRNINHRFAAVPVDDLEQPFVVGLAVDVEQRLDHEVAPFEGSGVGDEVVAVVQLKEPCAVGFVCIHPVGDLHGGGVDLSFTVAVDGQLHHLTLKLFLGHGKLPRKILDVVAPFDRVRYKADQLCHHVKSFGFARRIASGSFQFKVGPPEDEVLAVPLKKFLCCLVAVHFYFIHGHSGNAV